MLWMVILSPLIGFLLNSVILPRSSCRLSHMVAVAAMLISFVGALTLFSAVQSNGPAIVYGFNWISAGSFNAPFELVLDRLSTMMLLIITGIGSLIHIYAGGYMHEEKTTWRFFAYLNLFVFMMMLLVLGNNMLVMFVGWEGVGLCSYLLIGYWYHSDENAAAGMKAFLVNRIGDIGFLLGIFLTYKTFGTISFSELRDQIYQMSDLSEALLSLVTILTLCFFVGACGKSAQLPLYVWLPDAMAGPTPVSALIHAATMVTAGVYMMTRLHFFYYLAPVTMTVIAWTGALTALFAASIALVQKDIKKVLAYSTVSQLGYMVLACGVGAFDAGVFHLLTHACFKALLFLGAGSVIVAMHHKQNMDEMGGLKAYMPMTHAAMLVGVLAIIGVPGLSGFFSKDEILWKAFIFPGGGPLLWFVGLCAAGCTAFYMVRLLCLTFYGKNRSDEKTRKHLHETPVHMYGPLLVLGFLSVFVGYLGLPPVIAHLFGSQNLFAHWLEVVIQIPEFARSDWSHLNAHHSVALEWGLMLVSVIVAASGAFLAVHLYRNGISDKAVQLQKKAPLIHNLLLDKYRVDEVYQKYFVGNLRNMSTFLLKIIDISGINGAVNGVGQYFMTLGGLFSFNMTGSLHRHGVFMVLGILIFCLLFVI